MPWKKLLACVTGQIDEALRQKLEFVLEENRVYRALLARHSPHWRLQDAERKVLAEKGKLLGKLLEDVTAYGQIIHPCNFNTVILAWFLGSCAVKLSSCHGKSCWLASPFKSIRPCVRNWSSFWKITVFPARFSL